VVRGGRQLLWVGEWVCTNVDRRHDRAGGIDVSGLTTPDVDRDGVANPPIDVRHAGGTSPSPTQPPLTFAGAATATVPANS